MERKCSVWLVLVVSLVLIGCSDRMKFEPVLDIDPEFQEPFDQFIEEAALRGIDLEIDNLIIRYDEALEASFCGNCNSAEVASNIQKTISVNPNYFCWENDEQAETFIFHEMGHCVLGRLHTDEKLPNGDPKSLMIADDLSVYSPCVYNFDRDNNDCDNRSKREYYIDELFDESTPTPEWALP